MSNREVRESFLEPEGGNTELQRMRNSEIRKRRQKSRAPGRVRRTGEQVAPGEGRAEEAAGPDGARLQQAGKDWGVP